MGYGGKVAERWRSRELRAESWTLDEIARELGVAKSSVSVWVRDVDFVPKPRNRGHRSHRPHPLHLAKLAEIEECRREAIERITPVSERDLLLFGLALYAGEGSKRDGELRFANSNPAFMRIYATWLRTFFDIEEHRLRVRLYLHEGLDLEAAVEHWSTIVAIPVEQFYSPYRAVADPTIRRSKHEFGCATLIYNCTRTHRRVMAMIEAVSSWIVLPG